MSLHVTVLVTLFNDKRVVRTLESLAAQVRLPDAVLVADGGSTDGTLEAAQAFAASHPRVRVEHHAGSVAATRASALETLMPAHGDVVVFLDADQTAPPDWLSLLIAPLERGDADFTGGPTRPPGPPSSRWEAYLNAFEAWFYPNVVAHDMSKLPMGNSAWRLDVFRTIGNFDTRFDAGGEDYDINMRALAAGMRACFVPEAWVTHDQSHLDSVSRGFRRKYRYNVGGGMVYMKHNAVRRKARAAARNTTAFRHPFELANVVLQPVALAHAWLKWRRLRPEEASTERNKD